MNPRPLILLSTYNGERYLRCQIDSIIAQSFDDWSLIIRDDGSTDSAPDIISEYKAQDPRISVLAKAEQERLGACASFGKLLEAALDSDRDIYFLCDQDDRWHPDRLTLQMECMAHSPVPSLSFCELRLVNEGLEPLQTRAAFQSAGPKHQPGLTDLLTLNTIPGCSMAINRPLAELAVPLPTACPMHDWWLALAAAAAGNISRVDGELVDYRQHGANAIGGHSVGSLLVRVGSWIAFWNRGQLELWQSMLQAGELAERIQRGGKVSSAAIDALVSYSTIPASKTTERLKLARALRLRQGRWLERMVLYARLLAPIGKESR